MLKRLMFKAAYYIKKRRYLAGKPSPFLDKLVSSKVAARFGGRVRYLLSGGAPLSGETHEFINITVCAPVIQGYGLTEIMSGGCITHPDDRTTGNVGAPVTCCQIKLIDEPEMGYRSTDQPHPRGQICIGGANVTLGYYNDEKQTSEAYFTDSDGVRYFKTGDIGEWTEGGTLRMAPRRTTVASSFTISGWIGTALFYCLYEFIIARGALSRPLTGVAVIDTLEWASVAWTSSYLASIVWQHALHRALVFGSASPYWSSLVWTYVSYSLSIVLSSVFQHALVAWAGVNHRAAFVASLVITGFINYFTLKNAFEAPTNTSASKQKKNVE